MTYETDQWHKQLAQQLSDREKTENLPDHLSLLFQVELGLRLLEKLNLESEPVNVLWVLLQGLPIPDERLELLTLDQRKLLATARVLLPFTGRFTWENALHEYQNIESQWRNYDVLDSSGKFFFVGNCRNNRTRVEHLNAYDRVLQQPLEEKTYARTAEAGAVWFEPHLRNRNLRPKIRIDISEEIIEWIQSIEYPQFDARETPQAISISYEALVETAEYLDELLAANSSQAGWKARVKEYIHYRSFDPDTEHLSDPQAVININGLTHVVGMVGSGKSTLMKLIAAHLYLNEPQKKITLVVGDTISALDIADELNQMFLTNYPERPVAVPILGRTTRDRHLQRLYNSESFHKDHWGLRWLRTECLLMGLADDETLKQLEGSSIVPGREPCSGLTTVSESQYPQYKACPLFKLCPSHQLYHDLHTATIWITTPGALASSSIPVQFDERRPKVGELVYEQCDLVIFDEVDTIVEWFDNEYAKETRLHGGGQGAFDRSDIVISQTLNNRLPSHHEIYWISAARNAKSSIMNLLLMLESGSKSGILKRWVHGRYFTAFSLFNRLTKRFFGFTDWDAESETAIDELTEKRYEMILSWFDSISEGDPLNLQEDTENNNGVQRLRDLMHKINSVGPESIIIHCKDWIRQYVPEAVANLGTLNQKIDFDKQQSSGERHLENQETEDSLALRLAFALTVALLDRNIRIVFYEWHNQPQEINDAFGGQIYRPITSALTNVLPIPPMGQIFGTYYTHHPEEASDKGHILSRFEYSNVGRWYVLNYDRLLEELGKHGPHVLALSGTSWLPDSTRWHFSVEPQGILEAKQSDQDAIYTSEFAFIPQRGDQGKPISVSGSRNMDSALHNLVYTLVRNNNLQRELQRLQELEINIPDLWHDRARILLMVNSYSQAELAANVIRQKWPKDDAIYFLKRGDDLPDEDMLYQAGDTAIARADIENLTRNDNIQILVAPMNAIGRGYNILNKEKKHAAFGSIYFLVRPMPHPYDVQALAGELNARTLQWCFDSSYLAWNNLLLIDKGEQFRQLTKQYWRKAEVRRYYRDLSNEVRRDLAATTLGRIIQSLGRLVRGGVPFHAYFVDAKWAPVSAEIMGFGEDISALSKDTAKTSLLVAMIELLQEYVDNFVIGEALYRPFEGLLRTKNLYRE